ncbi:MAG: DUF1015 domain-containing protein [Candidatus Saccharicenans sp.]|nr:DUF1015 domain-containing protein [Candidatus Saccharicenans sp.]MDI6849053.1 DUF1015 domain-containing protein [Candidatus Saccharicenans sp.]
MKIFDSLGMAIPDILLPAEGLDLHKWAVIACDQYTSEPEYWRQVEELVGEAPSTLHLIYPEVYLNSPDKEERIARIQSAMKNYLGRGIFRQVSGMIYVERETAHGWRRGLLFCLDLEAYDFNPRASSLIRATEGTIMERIPPRVKIRDGAALEVPHIMILIDDPDNLTIGPAADHCRELSKLYDFELMFNSGQLRGYLVDRPEVEKMILDGLQRLASPEEFQKKYGLPEKTPLLLFAVGDGNHSLATAKTIWERNRAAFRTQKESIYSPLRYALVEVVNLHDESLVFEPIHRVLFEVQRPENLVAELVEFFGGRLELRQHRNFAEMKQVVNSRREQEQIAGLVGQNSFQSIRFLQPKHNLTVGSLQAFLDDYLKKKAASGLDYVHGDESLLNLSHKNPGNLGFYLPAMDKCQLFPTVILDGALPRKTFSMGEAWEKRFYLEARKLVD